MGRGWTSRPNGDRAAYYRAIQSVRESGMDLTKWLEYFAEGLAGQMREVQEKGERVIRVDVLTMKHDLSKRQGAAIGYALEHGGLKLRDYIALFPKSSRRTLQRELGSMVKKGLLIPEGATNRRHYRLGKT
jgi:Fic family protein